MSRPGKFSDRSPNPAAGRGTQVRLQRSLGTTAGLRAARPRMMALVRLLAACVAGHAPIEATAAAPADEPSDAIVAVGAATGPEALKQHTRITVETNAPLVLGTNEPANKEKSYSVKAAWEGWNGLHLEMTRKTLLGKLLPGVTNVEDKGLARLARIPEPWTNTYRLRLEEEKLTAKIGMKLAVDGATYVTGKDFKGFDSGIQVRRFRLYAKGDCILFWPVSYEIEVGYNPNGFYIEKSYLLLRNFPLLADLQGGQFQPPMGLEVITSSRDATFMEPAGPIEAMAPAISAGIQSARTLFDRRATLTLGLFTDGVGTDYGEATRNYGRAIARLTALPIYSVDPDRPDSAQVLHLGLSSSIIYAADNAIRYRSRPESHQAPYVVDTGDINADGALIIGGEAAWVSGPLSIQGEYLQSWVDEANGQVPSFPGLYASVSWFLTGETRPYNRAEAKFDRVIPKSNFNFGHGGWGAWEIAARYSDVNLDSADIKGGRLRMLMTGLNWYLHPNVKWRFDYGLGHVSGKQPAGNINVFQTRIEFDF